MAVECACKALIKFQDSAHADKLLKIQKEWEETTFNYCFRIVSVYHFIQQVHMVLGASLVLLKAMSIGHTLHSQCFPTTRSSYCRFTRIGIQITTPSYSLVAPKYQFKGANKKGIPKFVLISTMTYIRCQHVLSML